MKAFFFMPIEIMAAVCISPFPVSFFSFHSVALSPTTNECLRARSKIPFDGIRKHDCADLIFENVFKEK